MDYRARVIQREERSTAVEMERDKSLACAERIKCVRGFICVILGLIFAQEIKNSRKVVH